MSDTVRFYVLEVFKKNIVYATCWRGKIEQNPTAVVSFAELYVHDVWYASNALRFVGLYRCLFATQLMFAEFCGNRFTLMTKWRQK